AVAKMGGGGADYALGGVPREAAARRDRLYGPHSRAARADHQRYFVNPTLALYGLVLNTSRRPFSDPSLRRAVNYAIDRRALLRVTESFIPATPTDQYVPPGLPATGTSTSTPKSPTSGARAS